MHSGGIRRDMSIVEAEHPAGVPVSVTVEIGGKEISFETGKLAKQADGAVVVRSGETVVLGTAQGRRSEEHTSELQSRQYLVCRLLLEKKKKQITAYEE